MLQIEFLPVISFWWRILTRLDLLKPDLAKNVNHKQAVQKAHHNLHAKAQVLDVGQWVMARTFGEGPNYLSAAWSSDVCSETRGWQAPETSYWPA